MDKMSISKTGIKYTKQTHVKQIIEKGYSKKEE